ncbi:DUF1062 domain-containing protein [Roseibium sediminicola]|uniref:DUF1062 domain-containing protein n=1 Tax=Roseibium sediminicola TaxID=2933272 RepID=UPI003CE54D27
MSSFLNVEWTICCSSSAAIRRPCGRCGTTQSFSSMGKFRLNANGSRLDAWLIYSCQCCGRTWNRSVFERKAVASLSKKDLLALQSNDPGFAARIAQAPLICANGDVQPQNDFTLTGRHVPVSGKGGCPGLLVIRNPDLGRVRLDKVLVRGLRLSRNDLHSLVKTGGLRVRNASSKALRRPTPALLMVECHDAAGDEVMRRLRRLPE